MSKNIRKCKSCNKEFEIRYLSYKKPFEPYCKECLKKA